MSFFLPYYIMNFFEIISYYLTKELFLIGEYEYKKGLLLDSLPNLTLEFFITSFLIALITCSGFILIPTKLFFEVLILSGIIGIILDFFTLCHISSKNKKFLQNNSEKIPQNKNFIIFYSLWRLLLPDVFIVSSVMARFFRINLNKIQIFSLVALVHILRLSLLYFFYYQTL